jgi:hypothetical protein
MTIGVNVDYYFQFFLSYCLRYDIVQYDIMSFKVSIDSSNNSNFKTQLLFICAFKAW